jgi:YfiH family protein
MKLTLAELTAPGIRHGFFTREGGVSTGLFASLNCGWGSGDAPDHVSENRARAMTALGLSGDSLVTCNQVHGTEVVVVERLWTRAEIPRADAMVTRMSGVALGILAADCTPVLFADPVARVIGAAHAGWRGALNGVLEATVAAMRDLGAVPDRVRAGVGPSIAQASYEVGPEFPAPFLARDVANAAYFVPAAAADKFRFDLSRYVTARLGRLGLAAVAHTGGDTAAEPELFFSYRRSRLRGEPHYGRLLSAIALV